jgi:cell division septal protein FtsQ
VSRKPRRRKPSPIARIRPFWFLLVLVAAIAGAGGYYAATWPGFFPKSIRVSGNRVVTASEIAERAQISGGRNLWLQNMRAAAARVAGIPYIGEVMVHRALPASVRIEVTERVPYAEVRSGANTVTIDDGLRVIQLGLARSGLPIFETTAHEPLIPGTFLKDDTLRRLRDDFEALARAHVAVGLLRYDKYGDLVALTRGGVELMLGDESALAQTAALVDPILSQVAASGRKIAAVDLRTPRTPVVVYKH